MNQRLVDLLATAGYAIDLSIPVGVDEWNDPTYYAYIVFGDRLFRVVCSEEAFRAESQMHAAEAFETYEWTDIGAWARPMPEECPWRRAGVTYGDML
jgi:hypothetical protein